MIDPKTILVLAPHTDDGELGCGGSLARFAAEGKQVLCGFLALFAISSGRPGARYPRDRVQQQPRINWVYRRIICSCSILKSGNSQ